jgi:hypothetical protein
MTWWRRLWRRSAEAVQSETALQRTAQRDTLNSGKDSQFGSGLPYYTALDRGSLGQNRRDFSDLEDSPEMDRLRAEFESELLSPPGRPPEGKPLLTSLLGPSGVFTFKRPNSRPCLLSFSTPFRAGEYARIHAGSLQLQLKYLISSPQEFVRMLGDLRRSGTLESFALDVCPHCKAFPAYDTNSRLTPEGVVKIWAIHKSGEFARESLYFARAKKALERGNFQEAKETALEAIQHITSESPRLHLLVGKIALCLGEKDLLAKARTFLEFLQADETLQELFAAEKSSKIQN